MNNKESIHMSINEFKENEKILRYGSPIYWNQRYTRLA